jgi:hypothetical protein
MQLVSGVVSARRNSAVDGIIVMLVGLHLALLPERSRSKNFAATG